jgi:plastocyanin
MKYRLTRSTLTVIAITGALLLLLASACGSNSSNKTVGNSNASSNGAAAPAAAKDLNVTMTDNQFNPKTFSIPVGQDATFHLKNTGTAIHNMHIFSKDAEGKDFMSAAIINPGESNDFTVHFTKKGTYKFWCDFHTNDMTGTVTVQ